jgi:hypothetical protein
MKLQLFTITARTMHISCVLKLIVLKHATFFGV